MSDPAPRSSLEPTSPARILAEQVRYGLGSEHDLTGTCTLQLSDAPSESLTLVLEPGRCAIEAAWPTKEPHTRITLSKESAALLVTARGRFDYREPEVARRVTFSGDERLFTHVFHSLQRPAPAAARRLAEAEAASATSAAVAALTGLERVPDPPEHEVRARLAAGIPFIVTRALDAWPVHRSLDELATLCGAVRFKAALAEGEETFGDFMARARRRDGRAVYTLGTVVPEALIPLFPQPYFEPGELSPAQFWMGAGADETRPVTALHRDLTCGLLGQVHGRKRLTLYAPHEAANLYPKRSYLGYQTCWVDPSRPDLARYPLFSRARALEAVLEPGDLLVQPTGWFHCVYSLSELTMSVSNFLK